MTEPAATTVVLTPATHRKRARAARMLALFVVGALPVAAILVWLLNWAAAAGYVVVQTAFLMFGFRQHHEPRLRLGPDGVQFEAGSFVVRASWDDVDRVEHTTLPSGPTEALILRTSGLRWALDPGVRREVANKGWDRIVPLSDFEDDWRAGRIGAEVRRYAPRLVAATDERPAGAP